VHLGALGTPHFDYNSALREFLIVNCTPAREDAQKNSTRANTQ
jgi:hypothetical protein